MKSKMLVGALTLATGCLLGAISAAATTIEIGLAQAPPGIGPITTVATGTGATGAVWAGSYDNYLFNVIMAKDPNPVGLVSGTLDVTLPANWGGASGPIYVYVTETGLTSPRSSLNLLSQLSIDGLPAGWSETETTYMDATNAAYGTLTSLASSSGLGTKSISTNGVAVAPGSPFSVTEMYAIYSNGFAGVSTSTQSLTASLSPAPAPAIGSGLGALAVGGVLLGMRFLKRSRPA